MARKEVAVSTSGLAARLKRIAALATAQAASELQRELKEAAPVDTGRLQHSISVTPAGPLRYAISLDADKMRYTNSGTAPHWVFPVNGEALKVPAGDRSFFFNNTFHPGTDGTGWYDRTIEKWPALLERAFQDAKARA